MSASRVRVSARVELLDVARDAQHPAAVAEVALDLAGDRRHGEGRELAPRGRGRSGRWPSAARPTRPARGRRAARPCSRSAAPGCARAAASARRARSRAWWSSWSCHRRKSARVSPAGSTFPPRDGLHLPVLPACTHARRPGRIDKVDTPGHGPTCHHCIGMERVGKGGQTVSATRFAALTGVSRERLRTWERRYGFPEPHRDRRRAAPLRAGGRPARRRGAPRGGGRRADPAGDRAHPLRRGAGAPGVATSSPRSSSTRRCRWPRSRAPRRCASSSSTARCARCPAPRAPARS